MIFLKKKFLFFILLLSAIISNIFAIDTKIIQQKRFLKECPVTGQQISRRVEQKKAKHIVLIPGAGSQGTELFLGHFKWQDYFTGVYKIFDQLNIDYSVVPSDSKGNSSLEKRVRRTKSFLLKLKKEQKTPVALIGHSMGGIVARLVLREKKFSDLVSSVVYISSPHDGTRLVDFVSSDRSDALLIAYIAKILGFDLKDKQYLEELSTKGIRALKSSLDFADYIPPSYTVLNWQTNDQMKVFFAPLAITDFIIQKNAEGPYYEDYLSDGVVTLRSQLWGECLFVSPTHHGSVIGKYIFPSERPLFQETWIRLVRELANRGHFDLDGYR